ncbi:MAG: hypothetical protein ACYCW6_03660, partial [Candidatus Xenobia bacterium]
IMDPLSILGGAKAVGGAAGGKLNPLGKLFGGDGGNAQATTQNVNSGNTYIINTNSNNGNTNMNTLGGLINAGFGAPSVGC